MEANSMEHTDSLQMALGSMGFDDPRASVGTESDFMGQGPEETKSMKTVLSEEHRDSLPSASFDMESDRKDSLALEADSMGQTLSSKIEPSAAMESDRRDSTAMESVSSEHPDEQVQNMQMILSDGHRDSLPSLETMSRPMRRTESVQPDTTGLAQYFDKRLSVSREGGDIPQDVGESSENEIHGLKKAMDGFARELAQKLNEVYSSLDTAIDKITDDMAREMSCKASVVDVQSMQGDVDQLTEAIQSKELADKANLEDLQAHIEDLLKLRHDVAGKDDLAELAKQIETKVGMDSMLPFDQLRHELEQLSSLNEAVEELKPLQEEVDQLKRELQDEVAQRTQDVSRKADAQDVPTNDFVNHELLQLRQDVTIRVTKDELAELIKEELAEMTRQMELKADAEDVPTNDFLREELSKLTQAVELIVEELLALKAKKRANERDDALSQRSPPPGGYVVQTQLAGSEARMPTTSHIDNLMTSLAATTAEESSDDEPPEPSRLIKMHDVSLAGVHPYDRLGSPRQRAFSTVHRITNQLAEHVQSIGQPATDDDDRSTISKRLVVGEVSVNSGEIPSLANLRAIIDENHAAVASAMNA